jgi:sugar lactone lactonase YvrE
MACLVWKVHVKLVERGSDMSVNLRALAHKTWRTIASIQTGALAASLILVLLPSAWAGSKKKVAPEVDISTLIWPAPPDQPRIRYIGQYIGELDLLGKKQVKGGMLERIAGVTITPEERPRLGKPYGVAVDSKGLVYVADTAQSVVFVFDLANKKLEYRGDKAPATILMPIGVAVDEEDRLFVSDSKLHQITCFGPKGNVAGVFGADDLQRPAGMAVDNPLRRLYVADVAGQRIAVFDLDSFKLLHYFAEYKDKDADRTGALTNPNSIAIDPDGLIYVTDAIIPRVSVYDTDGNFVRVWGKRGDGPGMFGRPKGIAIDADGHVYVADALVNRLQVFSPEGEPLLSFSGNGWGPGQFMLMAGLAIDSQNRIIAVDQMPARIEVFHYITDAEAAAAKGGGKAPAMGGGGSKTATPGKAPHEAQPAAKPAASSGPTVEELQKELADLKAKLAAQQAQKPDAAGKGGTEPANKPAPEVPNSPN